MSRSPGDTVLLEIAFTDKDDDSFLAPLPRPWREYFIEPPAARLGPL